MLFDANTVDYSNRYEVTALMDRDSVDSRPLALTRLKLIFKDYPIKILDDLDMVKVEYNGETHEIYEIDEHSDIYDIDCARNYIYQLLGLLTINPLTQEQTFKGYRCSNHWDVDETINLIEESTVYIYVPAMVDHTKLSELAQHTFLTSSVPNVAIPYSKLYGALDENEEYVLEILPISELDPSTGWTTHGIYCNGELLFYRNR